MIQVNRLGYNETSIKPLYACHLLGQYLENITNQNLGSSPNSTVRFYSENLSHVYMPVYFFFIIIKNMCGCKYDENATGSSGYTLQWRHNERDGVSNHQRRDFYSAVYSSADQRKHQSSASLAFVRGIHRWPVNSPHKGAVTRKMFPFDYVIMVNRILESQEFTLH